MDFALTDLTPCTYCGAVADSIDHIPPVSIRPTLQLQDPLQKRWPFKEVDCCRECNSVLGDRALWTVSERKKFIKTRLRERYAKLLKMPAWEEDELRDMSPKMRKYIKDGLRQKAFVQARIAY